VQCHKGKNLLHKAPSKNIFNADSFDASSLPKSAIRDRKTNRHRPQSPKKVMLCAGLLLKPINDHADASESRSAQRLRPINSHLLSFFMQIPFASKPSSHRLQRKKMNMKKFELARIRNIRFKGNGPIRHAY